MQVLYAVMGYSNPCNYQQRDPSQTTVSVFKKLHSSQESLSPGHGGLVSAAGGNAHTGPPTEAPSRRGEKKKKKNLPFQARLSFKPALPQLYVYAKSTTERGEKGEWEPASAERGGGGENRKRGEQRKRGKQREGE